MRLRKVGYRAIRKETINPKIQITIVLVFILSRYWFKSIILDLFVCDYEKSSHMTTKNEDDRAITKDFTKIFQILIFY